MRDWLKEKRLKKNLTVASAAKKCGISKSYYDKIERGERTVSVDTAKKIGAALDFNWDKFYE